jgi:hypothetical protein
MSNPVKSIIYPAAQRWIRDTGAAPLSRKQRSSLRQASNDAANVQPGRRAWRNFVRNIVGDFMLVFASPKHNAMCENYGHVIGNPRWIGEFPRCADCGSQIRDKSDLRKAMHRD